MQLILLCRSLTTAQKAARILQKSGIYAVVTKAPQSANPGGCTYGVKIAERNRIPAMEAMERTDIPIERVLEAPDRAGFGVQV